VIYLAAMLVMVNSLSIGMVLAFIAYKNQLTNRLASLIEQLIQFKMMRLHLDRIADIALHEQEKNREGRAFVSQARGKLVLENISFSYSPDSSNIIDNLSMNIDAGDSVAIIGASGCGKSTLIKLMLGLLQPTAGRIQFDGQDITHMGLENYRKLIAGVMQNDTLLAGSIADNISFFDPEANDLKIEQCAQIASIHQDISKMSMGYNALVGDMGCNLSGGQLQRLILARALYKSPHILFMDEATSHLDVKNEARISEKVQELKMTRVIVAHRPETIKRANRLYLLKNGKLVTVINKARKAAVTSCA
jgi:ATP-binding cassette subfamily B protein RaxB